MTGNKDTNADPAPQNDGYDGTDREWERFMSDHGDELNELERSRSARKFDKAAKKAEKAAQFDVRDLKSSAFADTRIRTAPGPRDFQGRSWLDTDDVMDEDSTFTPPNPSLGPIRKSTVLFVAMLVVGVACLVAAIFTPPFSGLLGTAGGLLTLLGATGMFIRHRGHAETRIDPFDDGARV